DTNLVQEDGMTKVEQVDDTRSFPDIKQIIVELQYRSIELQYCSKIKRQKEFQELNVKGG
ncbi:7621_t:CDS:2, partial [Gigaspora margarita]